jgi:hypothetical protein
MIDQHFNNQTCQSRLSARADHNYNHFNFLRSTPANQRHLSFEKGGAFNKTLYFFVLGFHYFLDFRSSLLCLEISMKFVLWTWDHEKGGDARYEACIEDNPPLRLIVESCGRQKETYWVLENIRDIHQLLLGFQESMLEGYIKRTQISPERLQIVNNIYKIFSSAFLHNEAIYMEQVYERDNLS